MRNLYEREEALNLHFRDGMSYTNIAEALDVPKDTVKTWCRRYRLKMGLPKGNMAGQQKEEVQREYIHGRIPKAYSSEDRIARLEMEVDLLRNFLILNEGR